MKIHVGRFCLQVLERLLRGLGGVHRHPVLLEHAAQDTRAERESSTIRARLPRRHSPHPPRRATQMPPRVPAFYLDPGRKPIPANASSSRKAPAYALMTH